MEEKYTLSSLLVPENFPINYTTSYKDPWHNAVILTEEDAKAVSDALLRCIPTHETLLRSPLNYLTGVIQNSIANREVIPWIRHYCIPRLVHIASQYIKWEETNKRNVSRSSDLMFALRLLVWFSDDSSVELIRKTITILPDEYLWSIVFNTFSVDHPLTENLLAQFTSDLPKGFAAVVLLDTYNRLSLSGRTTHLFDSSIGRRRLKEWISLSTSSERSYAVSAIAAIPFLKGSDEPGNDELLSIALSHPIPEIQLEASWVEAKLGFQDGIAKLIEFAQIPQWSKRAVQYLYELKNESLIPEDVSSPDFQAKAEMCSWLSHPNEFGSPPDAIEIVDKRKLFWPPTNDERELWVMKYRYLTDGEVEEGLGLVGSITFALFSENNIQLQPEDLLGLHCCWELEMNKDTRAPTKRTPQLGREILGI